MCYPVPGPFQTPLPNAGTDATGEPDYNEELFTRFEKGGQGVGSTTVAPHPYVVPPASWLIARSSVDRRPGSLLPDSMKAFNPPFLKCDVDSEDY
ncbi:hypothetical protein CDAR_478131 [Caerostris darwini]|uniref:Uncharacterized protein n=1 Tax=Caerostris darwini TaxID=1538125 RepID=A0AAV4UK19_9ARAC|nr:hypothetical protein CDAR_478131 [Caerostris darwini]